MKKADYIEALVKAELGTAEELGGLKSAQLKAMCDGVESADRIKSLEDTNETLVGQVKERDEMIVELNQKLKLKELGETPGSDRTFSHEGQPARFLSPKLSINGKTYTPALCRESEAAAKIVFESKSPLIELITDKNEE